MMKHRFRSNALSNRTSDTPTEIQTVEKAKLIKPFADATVNALQVQCNITLSIGQDQLHNERHNFRTDIAAVIGLFGKKLNGAVCLFFDEQSYLKVMSKMMHEQFTALTPEIQDGAGELLNIIFGQAKTSLNANGLEVGKSIPTVITGPSLRIRQLTPKPSIIIPFQFDSNNLYLEIGLTQKII